MNNFSLIKEEFYTELEKPTSPKNMEKKYDYI